jgi:hypothetical protein
MELSTRIDQTFLKQLSKIRGPFLRSIVCLNRSFLSKAVYAFSICFLSCLDRGMTEQMLHICNGGTPTQQTSGKSPSEIV